MSIQKPPPPLKKNKDNCIHVLFSLSRQKFIWKMDVNADLF